MPSKSIYSGRPPIAVDSLCTVALISYRIRDSIQYYHVQSSVSSFCDAKLEKEVGHGEEKKNKKRRKKEKKKEYEKQFSLSALIQQLRKSYKARLRGLFSFTYIVVKRTLARTRM